MARRSRKPREKLGVILLRNEAVAGEQLEKGVKLAGNEGMFYEQALLCVPPPPPPPPPNYAADARGAGIGRCCS